MNITFQKGMTLIELTVVLLILIALAGLALPYVSGTSSKALCDATDVSMANIKKAIMNGYYLDMLGRFPQDLDSLTPSTGSERYNLHFLFSKSSLGARTHKSFDPDSATGWRSGGYLQGSIMLDSDMTGNFGNATYTEPLKQNHLVAIDSWGRPFTIQIDSQASGTCTNWGITTTENFCARLVSAGRGSGLGLTNADIDTTIAGHKQNDDRLLYLNVPTPATDINITCGDY